MQRGEKRGDKTLRKGIRYDSVTQPYTTVQAPRSKRKNLRELPREKKNMLGTPIKK